MLVGHVQYNFFTRWKRIDDLVWQGIFNSRVWQLYHKNDQLCYRVLGEDEKEYKLFSTEEIIFNF